VPSNTEFVNQALEEFRAYLETLTFIPIDPRIQCKVRRSDVVQETWTKAWLRLDDILALDAEARQRLLSRMFKCTLLDKLREVTAACRDGRLERSLEQVAAESAYQLQGQLAADDTPPPGKLVEQEEKERLAEALAQLPEREREVLNLKYKGWKLEEIAEHLGCPTNAVSGVYARGLARLRRFLRDLG
jgi:RNA polymerase sigma-70 factor (subfamily 1)